MLRSKKGVSLITLIITIIVVIILAVIVMRGTGGTIEQANYSGYMDDLGKVKEAVQTKAMEVKGQYLIDGRTVSMEEIYHYVATGGKTGDDFVGKANVPDYTIIDREKADIGIEMPTRNIESGTARNVQIQYIVTKDGEVFAWPPYEYENKLYITENITLAGKLDKNIQIEDENFLLELDETLGIILPASGDTSNGENGDGGDDDDGVYTVKLIPDEGISYISVATAENMEAEYPDLIDEYWIDNGNIMHSTDIYFEESEVVAEGNYIYIPTNYFVELEIPVENFVSVFVESAYGDGYIFDNLSVSVGEESFENEDIWYEFTMPASDVTIIANAREAEKYTITFDANGGSGTMENITQEENTIYRLPECTFTAPEGYEFSNWLVNGESKPVGASIDVISDVIVKAEWKEVYPEVGDYVIYPSDKGNITCRIWEIREDGSMVIMPSTPQGTLKLRRADGTSGAATVASAATSWLNAETTIQNYCKEYTSTELGVIAGDIESLTVEELNEKTGYTPSAKSKYAYYASGTSVSGTTTEADGLAGYTKAAHSSTLYNDITAPRFYTYDYAKNTATDEEGNTYAYPTSTDPVFVTNTHYNYNPSTVSKETAIYGEILGGIDGWLASSCVNTNSSAAYFYVRRANSRLVDFNVMCNSLGSAGGVSSLGVRPLVSLSSTLQLDSSVRNMNGTSSNPWQFVK